MEAHYENPLLRKAFTAHEALTDDEKERILAEKREESLMNERYELAAARRKGRKDERKEIAVSMLSQGISLEMIMKCTGLSRDETERLKKKSGPGNGGGKFVLTADKKDK